MDSYSINGYGIHVFIAHGPVKIILEIEEILLSIPGTTYV